MRKLAALAAIVLAGLVATISSVASLASRGGDGEVAGLPSSTYPSAINIISDPEEHHEFIGMPSNLDLEVTIENQDLVLISGDHPWVDVSGFIEGDQILASGTGTVAQNPGIVVDFQGKLTDAGLQGEYTMGASGGLPNREPIIYGVKPKEPPPTTTPEKLYSITVLKLNDETEQPLSGWGFNLYAGRDCTGQRSDFGTTGSDGLLVFTQLLPGTYSVEEKPQAGWNVVGDDCQDVEVGGTVGRPAGLPPCPTRPDQEFPQPGCDSFVSGARVTIELNATGQASSVALNGPTQVERKNKPADLDQDGSDEVQTEIVHMELTGGGITVRESASSDSTGAFEEQENEIQGTMDFPADSFFDVFFEVELPGGIILHNEDPFRIECKIDAIPPIGCFYQPPIPEPIVLFDEATNKIATIEHALHIPLPPNEVLVVFSNRPKVTPTPTPAPSRGDCEKVDQDVLFQMRLWDLWTCLPEEPSLHFNRVDIHVGKATQEMKLDAESPPLFVCTLTGEKAIGGFKEHMKDVNDDPLLPHHEVWSADFLEKCEGKVDVYLQARDPENHPFIKAVFFSNTERPTPPPTVTPTVTPTRPPGEPTATLTPTRPPGEPTATPTRRPGSGDANKDGTTNSIDAALVLQFDAALLASLAHPENADVNQNGVVNTIDAALILQIDAGLMNMNGGLMSVAPIPIP